MCPRSGFWCRGTSAGPLAPVFGAGEHPHVPSLRFGYRGTSAKTTLLETALLGIPNLEPTPTPTHTPKRFRSVFSLSFGFLSVFRACSRSRRSAQSPLAFGRYAGNRVSKCWGERGWSYEFWWLRNCVEG